LNTTEKRSFSGKHPIAAILLLWLTVAVVPLALWLSGFLSDKVAEDVEAVAALAGLIGTVWIFLRWVRS
jgi:hypothetical protein